jgi:hypothetical protein
MYVLERNAVRSLKGALNAFWCNRKFTNLLLVTVKGFIIQLLLFDYVAQHVTKCTLDISRIILQMTSKNVFIFIYIHIKSNPINIVLCVSKNITLCEVVTNVTVSATKVHCVQLLGM